MKKSFAITTIGTYIRLNALTDDSLNVALNTLSATEQSGVKVDAMSLSLVAGGSECRLRDLSLRLPHSHIAIDDITARYRRLADEISQNLASMVSNPAPAAPAAHTPGDTT